jgi:hypothetical protein
LRCIGVFTMFAATLGEPPRLFGHTSTADRRDGDAWTVPPRTKEPT